MLRRSRLSLLAPIAMALAAALPMHMSDVTSAAAPGDDPNADASAAGTSPESGTTSSATTATESADTGTTAAGQGEAGNGEAAAAASTGATASAAASSGDPSAAASDLGTDANGTALAATGDAPTVAVNVEDHAEARERFAGILAKLHGLEEEAAAFIREELHALGSLLHLHTAASGQATATGDYKPQDLS